MSTDISNSDDIIDSRNVIARIEELEDELKEAHEQLVEDAGATEDFETFLSAGGFGDSFEEEIRELLQLRELAEQGEGYSDWRHGATLIRDSYFKTYAMDYADDIGAIKRDAGWPNSCIDWDQAADELQMDYTAIEFDGVTYWVR